MRRTVFAFPRELLPGRLGQRQRPGRRPAGRAGWPRRWRPPGIARDGDAWAEEHLALVRRLIEDDGPLTTAEVRARPARARRPGDPGQGALPSRRRRRRVGDRHPRRVRARSCAARTTAAGRSRRPRWTATEQWLGEVPDPLPEPEGYAALVAAWLRSFGPGTEADLVWWLGATKAAVRRALADVEAVEVSLDGGAHRLGAARRPRPGRRPRARGRRCCRSLDPTTMGWKERAFHLGAARRSKVFDRNGNGGPTAWWDGRIVGVWCQRDDGTRRGRPRRGRPARRRAARSTPRPPSSPTWLDGDVVRSIYLSPLAREHLAANA